MTGSTTVSATVLVVDPDPSVSDRVARAFDERNQEIAVESARDVTRAHRRIDVVDCVVCEYDLGATDGLSFLDALSEQRPDLPVLMYTDSGTERIASEAIRAGVSDYVPKDEQSVDDLAARIVRAIDRAKSRRHTEAVTRINAVIREVDSALVRAENRTEVEQSVCDILADSEPYRFAWIGEYVPQHHRLLPRASAGIEDGFLDQLPVGEGTTLPEKGPGPRALETGEVAVTQNVIEADSFEPVREEAIDRGFRSVATVPLAHDGEVFGLLAVYADRPYAFDEDERSLLEKLGDDIGYALHALSLRAERLEFKEALEHAGHAICITDPGGTIEYVNPAFEAQTGYPKNEAVGRSLSSIQPVGPEDVRGELGSIPRDEDWKRELTVTRKDGTTYYAEQTIAPIREETGDLQGFVAVQADVTDRREQEEAIRRETEMLDSLLETSPIGIVVLAPDGSIERANKRAEDILSLSESEITERTYREPEWQFADESGEMLPSSEHPFNQVMEEGEPVYDLERLMHREHADPIWVTINGAPLYDPDGSLERVVFTFDDITSIKETQRALKETNQTLEALIQAAPVAIVSFDLDGGVKRWSEGAEEILGWTKDDAIGTSPPPHVPEDAVGEFEQFIDRAANGESFTGIEIERKHENGSWVDLHLSAAPLLDADGEVTGVMAVFADLTDQKAREEQLRQFRKAVEHAGHSVMITDPDGRIEYVNAAFEEQTGYDSTEALGRTPAILNSGDHEDAFFEEMWKTIRDGEVWEREIVNRRKDGTKIHVDQTIAPVHGESGDIEHFVAVNNDITDRKEYERELERQNQRLEEFASVVSHDLRNPLTVAKGRLDMLDVDGEAADRLEKSLDRMEAIIDDVLTLARDGQTVETREEFDLAALARDAWAAVDREDAVLEIHDLPEVLGDSDRTRRILSNLFRNAVEHGMADADDQSEHLTVEVGPSGSQGFYVADDGTGIDPDVRDSVFESGFSKAESGTGLGLAIVRRLSEAQGWSVSLSESETGGARFDFVPERSDRT
ncbi:MAG: PAS domain S-box protein [Halodesulfurarchaeum sp.]